MRIAVNLLDRIVAHATMSYPKECCGLLVGQDDRVQAVEPVRNTRADERYDRFEIDPLDHVRVWEAARAAGCRIIGCYHSHPDGRAYPSSLDRELACRFGGPFDYMVVSVDEEGTSDVYAGLIQADGEIIAVPLELETG